MTRSLRYVGVCVAALLAAGSSSAAYEAYLKIPGVQGDSSNALHPGAQGWTEVLNFSWGVGRAMNRGLAPSPGPGRLTIDSSSPELMQLCATGRHFPRLVLDVQGHEYVLDNVSVLSVSHPMAPTAKGTHTPKESISLNFTKIEQRNATLTTPAVARGGRAKDKR
jgi:type VI protein secretion system component Hcp